MIYKTKIFILLIILTILLGCKSETSIGDGLWIIIEDCGKYYDENGKLVENFSEVILNALNSCEYNVFKFDVTWQNKDEKRGNYTMYDKEECYKKKKTGVFFYSSDTFELKSEFLVSRNYKIIEVQENFIKLNWDLLILNKTVCMIRIPKKLEKNFLGNSKDTHI